jgi:hypothetical protein
MSLIGIGILAGSLVESCIARGSQPVSFDLRQYYAPGRSLNTAVNFVCVLRDNVSARRSNIRAEINTCGCW